MLKPFGHPSLKIPTLMYFFHLSLQHSDASFPVHDFRAGSPILDRENDLMHNLHFALVLFEGSGNSQSSYSTLSIHSLLNLIAIMSLNC